MLMGVADGVAHVDQELEPAIDGEVVVVAVAVEVRALDQLRNARG